MRPLEPDGRHRRVRRRPANRLSSSSRKNSCCVATPRPKASLVRMKIFHEASLVWTRVPSRSKRTARGGHQRSIRDARARRRVGVERSQLGHFEEVLNLAVADEIAATPAPENVERDHVGPALPGKRGQPLGVEPPLAIRAVDEREIDGPRVALALTRRFRHAPP